MKLTKQDLMRLPKERLAEIIVEMQDEKARIEFVPIPSPAIPNTTPWTEPFGPTVTYAQNPNTPAK
jgi:hypothetical protein